MRINPLWLAKTLASAPVRRSPLVRLRDPDDFEPSLQLSQVDRDLLLVKLRFFATATERRLGNRALSAIELRRLKKCLEFLESLTGTLSQEEVESLRQELLDTLRHEPTRQLLVT